MSVSTPMAGTLDLVVLAIYFAGMLSIGYFSRASIKSSADFSVASGRLRLPLMLGTLIGTAIGASATMGRVGKTYEFGAVVGLSSIAYALGLTLFAQFAPQLRRFGVWSIPAALDLRYGKAMRLWSSIIILLAVVAVFAVQLVGFGAMVVPVLGDLGVTYGRSVIAGAFLMVAYTGLGGMLAVARTDGMQLGIMVVVLCIVVPLVVISEAGGFRVGIEHVEQALGAPLGAMSLTYLVSVAVIDVSFCFIDPSLWQRVGAAQSLRTFQVAIRITALASLAWAAVMIGIGLLAQLILRDADLVGFGGDGVLPILLLKTMPTVLLGLGVAALMAVIMSTASSLLLIAGNTVSHDLVKEIRRHTSDRALVRISRAVMLLTGLAGAAIAIHVQGIFDALLMSFALPVSGLLVPTFCAFFWSGATRTGAVVSSVSGVATVCVAYLLKQQGMLPEELQPIFLSLAVSLAAMFGASAWSRNSEGSSAPLTLRAPLAPAADDMSPAIPAGGSHVL